MGCIIKGQSFCQSLLKDSPFVRVFSRHGFAAEVGFAIMSRDSRWFASWRNSAKKPIFYHIVSRVVERRLAFGPEEKEQFHMIKGQAFCQSFFSTWFCGRGSFCHHESEIEVVGELAEFCKKTDFLPHRFTCG